MDISDEIVASNCSSKLERHGISLSEDACKRNILNHVASSNEVFFKSQQRGEAELTFDEKREIAEDLLSKNNVLFLQRYHKILRPEDLYFFDNFKDNYEVNFYLEEIRKKSDNKKYRAIIKNRRYEALKRLRSEGSYFSDSEMRHRSPHLYEQLIGQYLTDSERSAVNKTESKYSSFSGFLMHQIEKSQDERLLRLQENSEEREAIEAGVDDFSEDERNSDEEETEYVSDEEPSNILMKRVNLPDDEKQRLRTEFTNLMYENFLSGKDQEFDYSTVDENAEYDSVQQREIDEEEKYFDEESPEMLRIMLQNMLLNNEEM